MNTNIFFILTIFLLSFSKNYAQANLKFNQTFSSMNAVHVDLDVKSKEVVLKTIKGSRVVVEMLIHISSPNTNLLDFMAKGGRYDLEKSFNSETQTLVLTAKNHKNIISIKGKEVSEQVSYVIYLPETMQPVHDTIAVNL